MQLSNIFPHLENRYFLYSLQVQESIHNTYSFKLQRKYNSNKKEQHYNYWANLQKLLEKKEEKGKTSHYYGKNQCLQVAKLLSVSIIMTNALYQSTHTVGTKHGYHIDASQKSHYVGTTSEQRRVYVDPDWSNIDKNLA